MKRVKETFISKVIDKSKLDIYCHFAIPAGDVSLNRTFLDRKKFKENDLVRVTVTLVKREK